MSLYSLLESLRSSLATHEAALVELNAILAEINTTLAKVESLKGISLNVLAINDKPFKEELINSSKGNISNAANYISGTAIPLLKKKIEDIRNQISSVEAEIARQEEEERRKKEEDDDE